MDPTGPRGDSADPRAKAGLEGHGGKAVSAETGGVEVAVEEVRVKAEREAIAGKENQAADGTMDSAGPAIHSGARTGGTETAVETGKSPMAAIKNVGLEN
jgi:hypothetical protein